MAELLVLGPFNGPGEERTVETLAQELPSNWYVLSGRTLPTRDRDDMDVVVVGSGKVFLLEEKSWGPKVVLDDLHWETSRQTYRSPINRLAVVSRKLRGYLNGVAPELTRTGRHHRVHAAVVLSHPNLELAFGPSWTHQELVLPLRGAEATKTLVEIDGEVEPLPQAIREKLVSALAGLSASTTTINQLGNFRILQELAPLGRMIRFSAVDPITAEGVELHCLPLHGWGPGVDPTDLLHREALAMFEVEKVDRTFHRLPTFEDEQRQWWVTPVRQPPTGTRPLSEVLTISPNDPKQKIPELRAIVAACFAGLADLHRVGVVHRALSPHCIYLDVTGRVRFTDFVVAKLPESGTVAPYLDDLELLDGALFRAPEVFDLRYSDSRSDVFALASVLQLLLKGHGHVVPDEISGMLARCSAEDPAARPSASTISESFQDEVEPALTVFTPRSTDFQYPGAEGNGAEIQTELDASGSTWQIGSVIDDRYELVELLGRGSFATSWRANYRTGFVEDVQRTIKQFHVGVAAADVAAEFLAVQRIYFDRCGRVFDIAEAHGALYIVMDYVHGEDLHAYLQRDGASLDVVAKAATDVLEALDYVHRLGVIHGDVSQRNVIVEPSGRGKLIDFGLALLLSDPKRQGGTPGYRAPETFTGQVANPASDIFGWGAFVGESLLGRSLLELERPSGRPVAIMAPSSTELNGLSTRPRRLVELAVDCIALDPDSRPTAEEVLGAVDGRGELSRKAADTQRPSAGNNGNGEPLPAIAVVAKRRLRREPLTKGSLGRSLGMKPSTIDQLLGILGAPTLAYEVDVIDQESSG